MENSHEHLMGLAQLHVVLDSVMISDSSVMMKLELMIPVKAPFS